MKKNSVKNINKYEENLSLLTREVTHFKHTFFKKETRKVIAMKHFLKYFESRKNSFANTPLDLIWCFNTLTHKFLEDISNYKYDDIIPLIIKLLSGYFENTVKKTKLVDLRKPNQKIISFYFLPLSKTSDKKTNKNANKNILFSLCLKGFTFASSNIYFLSISSNWDYEEIAQNFLKKVNSDNDFPLIEFDINGIYLVNEILFSHKEKDKLNNKTMICYPLKNISVNNNTIFKIILTNKINRPIFNDANDFNDNELNISIINQIETNQYETLIISAIEGGYWDYKLSLQEKKCVKNSDTFILSGRPGTGKTTVILFKLFSIYFNYILKKKQRLINDEYKKNNVINSKNNRTVDSLRVVFTSLSQNLCEKQQTIFEQTMVRKIDVLDSEYFPASDASLRIVSSFRNFNQYPIFVNFRKIMFMIDGSLTFQFFSRHNLDTYEGDHNTEYFYSKDYVYDVNKYSYNEQYKYINFFVVLLRF